MAEDQYDTAMYFRTYSQCHMAFLKKTSRRPPDAILLQHHQTKALIMDAPTSTAQ
jgi:hypothetical protein